MTIKPICVIYFPKYFSMSRSDLILDPFELMKELNGWGREGILYPDEDRFGGYQYWCFHKEEITAPEFKVFHPKDFTEADYEELKQLVMSKLNEPKDATTT